MDFTKNGNIYETTFSASTPFNIHIERDGGRVLSVSRRTAGEGWETIEIIRQGRVIDADVYNDIEREFRIQSDVEPTMCEITFGSAVAPDVPTDVPTETWIDYTVSGNYEIVVGNAKRNSIVSLIADGYCYQSSNPSPASPKSISCNKGVISYYTKGNNLLEVTDDNIIVGKYINNAGVVTGSLPNLYFQRFVSVKPSTAYTLSTSETLNYANFMEYDSNGVFIKRTLYGSSGTPAGKVVTHTMGASTAFVIVGSNVNGTKYPEITKDDVKGIKWMFNMGTSAKAYEDYRKGFSLGGVDVIRVKEYSSVSAEMLLNINTYTDKQDIISGVVTRKIGIKVFDGSESSWYLSMSGDVYRYRYKFDEDDNAYYKNGRGTDMLSTHFKVLSSGSTAGGAFLNGSSNAEYLFLIPNQSITTLEDFRKWLQMQYAKGMPVMVIYPLAEDKIENVAPQSLSNPEGTITLQRDVYAPFEVTLKVKKVSGSGEIKEFTLNNITYQYEDGMTWGEFLDSAYNVDGWYRTEWYSGQENVALYDSGMWYGGTHVLMESGGYMPQTFDLVKPTEYLDYSEGGIGGGGGGAE